MTRAKTITRTADRPKSGKVTRRQKDALRQQAVRGESLRAWVGSLAARPKPSKPADELDDHDREEHLEQEEYDPDLFGVSRTSPARAVKAARVNGATGRPSRKARKGRRAYRLP